MSLIKSMWLTIVATVVSLIVVLLLSGDQLFVLYHQVDNSYRQQQLSANLYQFKAAVLSLARADPLLPETAQRLQRVDALSGKMIQSISAALDPKQGAAFRDQSRQLWQGYRNNLQSAIQISQTAPQDALSIPEQAYQQNLSPLVDVLDKQQEAASRQPPAGRAGSRIACHAAPYRLGDIGPHVAGVYRGGIHSTGAGAAAESAGTGHDAVGGFAG